MSALNMFRTASKLSQLASKSVILSSSNRPLLPSSFLPVLSTRQPFAQISTSKKNRDGTGSTVADGGSGGGTPKADDFSYEAAKKKWVSYGFHWESEEEDLNTRNFVMFMTVTVLIVGFTFAMSYYPDVKRKDWYQRQAYIELARREALGLPPIDENLVPPENINLPTEEELGDFEIII